MEILILIIILIAIILTLVGIIGAIVPAIPGPPISFVSLLMAYFTTTGYISTTCLAWMFVITIIVSVLDYVAPIWLTKLGGGSKQAIWGSTLGIIAGLFFMPVGLIVGPLVGAFLGEMMHDNQVGKALKVALMSFVAFLLTTGLKLMASLLMTFYTLNAIWGQGADFVSRFFAS